MTSQIVNEQTMEVYRNGTQVTFIYLNRTLCSSGPAFNW